MLSSWNAVCRWKRFEGYLASHTYLNDTYQPLKYVSFEIKQQVFRSACAMRTNILTKLANPAATRGVIMPVRIPEYLDMNAHGAGMILKKGADGIPGDPAAALQRFLKACDGGLDKGCYNASVLYLKGL